MKSSMDKLLESMGAVYGWCWCKYQGMYVWRMLYWPAEKVGVWGPQRARLPPAFILAGFMSQHRGLSWDRRSRRGTK